MGGRWRRSMLAGECCLRAGQARLSAICRQVGQWRAAGERVSVGRAANPERQAGYRT